MKSWNLYYICTGAIDVPLKSWNLYYICTGAIDVPLKSWNLYYICTGAIDVALGGGATGLYATQNETWELFRKVIVFPQIMLAPFFTHSLDRWPETVDCS